MSSPLDSPDQTYDLLTCLQILQTMIAGLDSYLDKDTPFTEDESAKTRLFYARNTLAVNARFWQEDICSRLEKSDPDLYIFCMTQREKDFLQNRLIEGFRFARSGILDLKLPRTTHYPAMIDNLVEAILTYTHQNKFVLQKSWIDKESIAALGLPSPRSASQLIANKDGIAQAV